MTAAYQELRVRSEVYSRIGYVGALILHAMAFALWPNYVPRAFELRQKVMEVIEVARLEEIPIPPREIQRPQIPAEADPSEFVDESVTIPRTILTQADMAQVANPAPALPDTFVPYDQEPLAVSVPTPLYPRIALEAELEGYVVVEVTVDTMGHVVEAVVVESSSAIFNEEALHAARAALFRPAMQRDEPVRCRAYIPFRFRLR